MFGQEGFGLRLEWGGEGVTALGGLCAVLVVVDVLSFTTSVDVVVGRGAKVRPVRWLDQGAAAPSADPTWTLRPSSLTTVPRGQVLELPSPNGATLCTLADSAGAAVLAGCLRNAEAVARVALEIADGRPIGLIPAGERWGIDINTTKSEQFFGPLRPCVEDFMGAGAILAALLEQGAGGASVEAQVAADAFRSMEPRLEEVVAESVSGRELIGAGHAEDVGMASLVNVSKAAPRLVDGVLQG
ncbi:2-phosphosulfolactate phosphatase [Umezawaea sp. Da 62-37]|uniref:2-phosphosulfolactate phosphatase n=1 Tax=Umezawaea sp. Da 62-37 TaxID=3075927 RepID=UPI0028F70A72|nr:2-phosphosulfolactate phosphatase [Umezawaea sp. Da 62-37]WNV83219.1 2-phosphosulfolactate phosphatase [Umezawaea sp. Da 62-37]